MTHRQTVNQLYYKLLRLQAAVELKTRKKTIMFLRLCAWLQEKKSYKTKHPVIKDEHNPFIVLSYLANKSNDSHVDNNEIILKTHTTDMKWSWKSTGDCIRNANKSPKIPNSATMREVEKWSGIWCRTRSPPEVNRYVQLLASVCVVGPITTPSFNEISWLLLQCSCIQNNRQRKWLKNSADHITCQL